MGALADATRLRILGLLAAGEVCVCHIHESLKISQPKASRHLGYLRRAGLVATRREGLWVHYRVAESRDLMGTAIMQAAMRELARIESVQGDARRLQSATACRPPDRQVRRKGVRQAGRSASTVSPAGRTRMP
jgi:ArsR family transcriptional regulator